jgi:ATP-dependent protease ClpP protease subunit
MAVEGDVPASEPQQVLDEVRRALLARRIVLAHGTLDDRTAAAIAASLMMLDATGDDRVVLRMTGTDATIETGLVLIDVIDVLGVPVDTVGAGTLAGGAVGVLAAGRNRLLAQHSRLRLREPDSCVSGRAVDIERAVAEHEGRRDRFLAHVAARTGRPLPQVVAEWDDGSVLEAADAVSLGYADDVESRTGSAA